MIVNVGVELDGADLRDVYLGEKQWVGDVRLLPVDNRAAYASFLASKLQTTPRNYEARWTRKAFRDGLRIPALMGSDAEVMSFVRSTPGAIGYLAGTASPGVRVIDHF